MTFEPGQQAMASATHMDQVHLHLPDDLALATKTLSILTAMVDLARQTPIEEEANTLAAWLCFRRATEQLRVGFMAALLGHYSEIGLLVRAVYESAGLGRKLALEPEEAEHWLRDGSWHPDREVRKWIRERRGDEDAGKEYYQHASDHAHTTFVSTLAYWPEIESRARPMADHIFDEADARSAMRGITMGGLFAVHCLRNACPEELVFPTDLRRAIVDLTSRAGGETDHLEREWRDEETRRQRMLDRVQDVAGLDERLDRDPNSIRNLRSESE